MCSGKNELCILSIVLEYEPCCYFTGFLTGPTQGCRVRLYWPTMIIPSRALNAVNATNREFIVNCTILNSAKNATKSCCQQGSTWLEKMTLPSKCIEVSTGKHWHGQLEQKRLIVSPQCQLARFSFPKHHQPGSNPSPNFAPQDFQFLPKIGPLCSFEFWPFIFPQILWVHLCEPIYLDASNPNDHFICVYHPYKT